jgi:hypothetical protein
MVTGVCDKRSFSLQGSWEIQRPEVTRDGKYPSKCASNDLFLPPMPHLLIGHSIRTYQQISKLVKLIPLWFSHISVAPPAGDQAFNTWACGVILYPNHKFSLHPSPFEVKNYPTFRVGIGWQQWEVMLKWTVISWARKPRKPERQYLSRAYFQ